MSTEEKLYLKLKNNPKNVQIEDIERLLFSVGFVHRRTTGSHHIYSHPQMKDINDYVNIPFKRPIKPNYVRAALLKYEKALDLL